jgi:hypothetical protein
MRDRKDTTWLLRGAHLKLNPGGNIVKPRLEPTFHAGKPLTEALSCIAPIPREMPTLCAHQDRRLEYRLPRWSAQGDVEGLRFWRESVPSKRSVLIRQLARRGTGVHQLRRPPSRSAATAQ